MRAAAKMPIALVTGFAPFDGDALNPSAEIARALHDELIAGHRIVGAELPTEFASALPRLTALIATHKPRLVVALGLAAGRSKISLERVAINLIDARIMDNAGVQPVDEPVAAQAPAAYFTTLPVKAMLQALREARIPAALSLSAGTFVCNQVFFGLLRLLAQRYRKVRGGFIHVPCLPQQSPLHSHASGMELDTMLAGIRLALHTALTTQEDAHYAAGTTD